MLDAQEMLLERLDTHPGLTERMRLHQLPAFVPLTLDVGLASSRCAWSELKSCSRPSSEDFASVDRAAKGGCLTVPARFVEGGIATRNGEVPALWS